MLLYNLTFITILFCNEVKNLVDFLFRIFFVKPPVYYQFVEEQGIDKNLVEG